MTAPLSSESQETVPLITDSDADGYPAEFKRKALEKLTRRVVLLCMGIVFCSYIDRCNVGYAASNLCADLQLSHSEYGTVVSLFYVGYIIAQPPSSIMLRRFGPPMWLSFIVFTWGGVATASAFVQSRWQFYVIRVLLGVAEGGTFPGIFYYLGFFFPDEYIDEAYTYMNAAVSLSMPLSSPIAAGLLSSDGIYGTTGWRNIFFVEGLMSVIYAIFLFLFLPRSLETAAFLDSEEKEWLINKQNGRKDPLVTNLFKEIWEISKSLRFWLATFCWGTGAGVFVSMLYWTTLIIQNGLNHNEDTHDKETCGTGESSVLAVILTAIPYLGHGFVSLSYRTKVHSITNRPPFSALLLTISSIIMLSWVWTRKISFVFGFLSLTIAITVWSNALVFAMGIIATLFRPELRSTAFALANGLGNLESFLFPLAIGFIVDSYGYSYAITFSAAMVFLAAIMIFAVKDPLSDLKKKENRV